MIGKTPRNPQRRIERLRAGDAIGVIDEQLVAPGHCAERMNRSLRVSMKGVRSIRGVLASAGSAKLQCRVRPSPAGVRPTWSKLLMFA